MKRKALITIALGSCSLGLLSVSCDSQDNQKIVAKAPAIQTFNIIEEEVSDSGEWFGFLRGTESTTIRPRVTGFLLSQDYMNGTFVKKDTILFRIEPDLFQTTLDQAKANLLAAEASLTSSNASQAQAQLDVKRYEKLVRSNAVSEKELDDAKQTLIAATASVEMAKATISKTKATVLEAQINLDYTVIRAPFDGIVGTAEFSKGELLNSSSELANISSVNPIRVDFAINGDALLADFLEFGGPGSADKGGTKFNLILEDGSTYDLPGSIIAADSKVDNNGVYSIVGSIPNPEGLLRAGMSVRVSSILSQYKAILVPEDSIRSTLRSKFILIVDKSNHPILIPVVVKGNYDIQVKEANGYESTQKLVAISGYNETLSESFKRSGYDKITDVPVINDKANSLIASKISANNSRIPELVLEKGQERPKSGTIETAPFSFKPIIDPAQVAEARSTVPKLDPNAKASLPKMPVKVTSLKQQDVQITDEWFGNVRGVDETELRAKVSGFILSKNFKDGSMVKKGDILFTIDPAPFQASLDKAEANLAVANASLDQAKANLAKSQQDAERYINLNKSSPGAVSDKTITDTNTEVLTNTAAVMQAKASIAQMAANVNEAKINLAYTDINAPFDGRAGIASPSVGDLVGPSSTEPLVSLSSVNPMRIDFQVSGKVALRGFTKLSEKQDKKSLNAIPFSLLMQNGRTYPQLGNVVSIDNAVSKTAGTLTVVGHVDNPNGSLRSGMPVRVLTRNNSLPDAYIVPARAVQNQNNTDFIMYLLPNGAPAALPVTKGKLVNLEIEGPDGKKTLQPMHIIDINRDVVGAGITAMNKVESLEEIIFQKNQVKSWEELIIKQAGASSIREIMEKQAGKKLPDDAPALDKRANWADYYVAKNEAKNMRDAFLKQAKAKDELDLIARASGSPDALIMVLKQHGVKDLASSQIIVEGGFNAGMIMQANKAAGNIANTVLAKPFQYTQPKTTEASVTAEAAPSRNAKTTTPSSK